MRRDWKSRTSGPGVTTMRPAPPRAASPCAPDRSVVKLQRRRGPWSRAPIVDRRVHLVEVGGVDVPLQGRDVWRWCSSRAKPGRGGHAGEHLALISRPHGRAWTRRARAGCRRGEVAHAVTTSPERRASMVWALNPRPVEKYASMLPYRDSISARAASRYSFRTPMTGASSCGSPPMDANLSTIGCSAGTSDSLVRR